MNLSFDLTVEDMVALAIYHSDHSPRERRRRLLVQGFIVIVFAFLLVSGLSSVFDVEMTWTPLSATISFLPLVCPAILVLLVFSPAVRHWSTRRSVHKAFGHAQPGQVVAHQQLSVSGSGIDVKTKSAEGRIEWPEVRDLSVTEKHAFVFTASEQAIVVPAHAFGDDMAFRAFVAQLDQYRLQAAA